MCNSLVSGFRSLDGTGGLVQQTPGREGRYLSIEANRIYREFMDDKIKVDSTVFIDRLNIFTLGTMRDINKLITYQEKALELTSLQKSFLEDVRTLIKGDDTNIDLFKYHGLFINSPIIAKTRVPFCGCSDDASILSLIHFLKISREDDEIYGLRQLIYFIKIFYGS